MNLELFSATIGSAMIGWVAIFGVTLVIVGCISLLNKLGSSKKNDENK